MITALLILLALAAVGFLVWVSSVHRRESDLSPDSEQTPEDFE